MSVLVLITGTGRSGTSTMSGTLHHLGLNVPGPHLGANESNPKGFFESRWSVRFHNALTQEARINVFDGRPGAFERIRAVLSDEHRAQVAGFLEKKAAGHTQTVVKDPRTVWTQALWREAAADAGMEIRYISMLRHPAEVVGSRTTYYAGKDEAKRRRYEIFNVARWVNSSLISERETRGQARAFVRYTDLLDDWRPVLTRIGVELGLSYDVDPASGEPSAVDDFIDPGLRRHRVTWDELEVPEQLREIAERVWDDLLVLGSSGGSDAAASADLDRQSERYERLLQDSAAISHDLIAEGVAEARQAAISEERERQAAESDKAAEAPAPPPALAEIGGRELLRALGTRLRRRLPGSGRGQA